MADLADHAHSHAGAVLGFGDAAADAALVAVRRGGRSRSSVLGHARHEALIRSVGMLAPDLDQPLPEDLTDLAVVLASTRPALERCVVDLDARHGLDRGGFARAVGLSPSAAATRAASVFQEWHQHLDPLVLARLGPGGCDELATILNASGLNASGLNASGLNASGLEASGLNASEEVSEQPTLRILLATGPAVVEHVEGCAPCGDRLRSMVSVRTLLGQQPVDPAPAAVCAAAAPSRLRRPSPPPALEREAPARPWQRPVGIVAAALVLAAVIGAVIGTTVVAGKPADGQRVEALVRVPAAGSVLAVTPASVEGPSPQPVMLRNTSEREVAWLASPDEGWLGVSPESGRLAPGAAVPIRFTVATSAPEGDARGSVRITSADGSTTVVRLETTVEHPPDVAATLDGCDVRATVEDESQIATVTLRSDAQAETALPLTRTETGFTGRLPASVGTITWWVEAVDARGNLARTADQTLPPNSCSP